MLLKLPQGALRRSPHGIETSLTLRRRCADALAFLEAAKLAVVSLPFGYKANSRVAATPDYS
jgi:hypothetical protein